MRALHLPGVAQGEPPSFSFPTKPPPPSALRYASSGQRTFPVPEPPTDRREHIYQITVYATALTRGELTWSEILLPSRFHPWGGAVPGHDLVGTVRIVYPSSIVTAPPKFAEGDLVWGLIDFDRDGAAADFAFAYESELAHMPAGPSSMSPSRWKATLASLPLSGLTAHQALFTHGGLPVSSLTTTAPLTPQPRILIIGSTGSVGILTCQLAKAASFHVTALCSNVSNSRFLKEELHVDQVIDYTAPDYTTLASYMSTHSLAPADLVIDCVGGSTLRTTIDEPGAVRPGGKLVTIAAPLIAFGEPIASQLEEECRARNIDVAFFVVKPNGVHLSELGQLVTQGKLTGYVDSVYPLEDGVKAMEKVETKGAVGRGKVVLRVNDDGQV